MLLKRIAIVVSLVLAGGVALLWGRSYAVGDRYRWVRIQDAPSGRFVMSSGGFATGIGGIRFVYEAVDSTDPNVIDRTRRRLDGISRWAPPGYRTIDPPRYPMREASNDSVLASLGFHFDHWSNSSPTSRQRQLTVTVPFWAIFLALIGYPLGRYVAGVVRRQREDRLALGLCPRCGVPLNDALSRCPGCDRPIPRPNTTENALSSASEARSAV
ncbi:hypothetical protein [Fontivita pretiosa]|uniref:hypothetical protein n=1 Tax=Fontivita pretiosa TaxID=2989684 RepID=UPI003D1706D4